MPLRITHDQSPTHRGPLGVEVSDVDGVPILKGSDPWWRRAVAVWLSIKEPTDLPTRVGVWLMLWDIWRPFRPLERE